MINYFLPFLLLGITSFAQAQKYDIEKSSVTFFSSAPIENITAHNEKSAGLLDLSTAQVAFSIPISGFEFEKKLMQEHFNEKYMETEKYPRSTFQGQILNLNPKMKGEQKVSAKGKLTIHGVTKDVEISGSVEIAPDKRIVIKSKFTVSLKDYNITIPQLLWQNIAEQIEINLDAAFKLKSK